MNVILWLGVTPSIPHDGVTHLKSHRTKKVEKHWLVSSESRDVVDPTIPVRTFRQPLMVFDFVEQWK